MPECNECGDDAEDGDWMIADGEVVCVDCLENDATGGVSAVACVECGEYLSEDDAADWDAGDLDDCLCEDCWMDMAEEESELMGQLA